MTWTKPSPALILLSLLLQGCGIYSFAGSALPPEVKTFSLKFQSSVALGPPNLVEKFQQRLGDELLQCTSLKQVYTKGDLQLDGDIKQFKYEEAAPTKGRQESEGEQAAIARLTIEVQMSYINCYDEDASFSKKTFSQYADVAANASREKEEPRLIDDVCTKLIEDIFNETVASW
jgi:Lipopolysaccharide-assembly